MERLTEAQARYLYRKFNFGDISDRFLAKMLGLRLYIELVGGWFVDFYYDEIAEEW